MEQRAAGSQRAYRPNFGQIWNKRLFVGMKHARKPYQTHFQIPRTHAGDWWRTNLVFEVQNNFRRRKEVAHEQIILHYSEVIEGKRWRRS